MKNYEKVYKEATKSRNATRTVETILNSNWHDCWINQFVKEEYTEEDIKYLEELIFKLQTILDNAKEKL